MAASKKGADDGSGTPARRANRRASSAAREPDLTPPFRVMSHIMYEQLRRLQDALRPLGINGPIWRILSELDACGTASIRDLARRSALERSNVSRIVDKLIDAGLLESVEHEDKRVHMVRLSEAGRERFHEAEKVVDPLNKATISVYTAEELDQLNRLLERLAIVFGAARD